MRLGPVDRVVLTGGEPSLQLDDALVTALHEVHCRVHVETNGSNALPSNIDWVTLSPKPPMPVVAQRYDEVKVIFPAVDPLAFAHHASLRYVQPLWFEGTTEEHTRQAIDFVLAHPEWRLSVQMHKALGVP